MEEEEEKESSHLNNSHGSRLRRRHCTEGKELRMLVNFQFVSLSHHPVWVDDKHCDAKRI